MTESVIEEIGAVLSLRNLTYIHSMRKLKCREGIYKLKKKMLFVINFYSFRTMKFQLSGHKTLLQKV
jgi:hypothetical protein